MNENQNAESSKEKPSTDMATPADIVAALKTVAGNQLKARASFAKGICFRGTFNPSPGAENVTKSKSFTERSEVLGRFSVGGGNPQVPDTNRLVLRGMSIRLGPSDHQSDLIVESAPVHFARDLDQMLGFLKARFPGSDGKPDPAVVKAFTAANPETAWQSEYVAARPLPASYLGTVYWGVHAFPSTDSRGVTRFIKFKVVPVGGELTIADDKMSTLDSEFLRSDLESRIAKGVAKVRILALLDRPGDKVMDVTARWVDEDTRDVVELGIVSVEAITDDDQCNSTIFNPGTLAEGIGHPPDPIFAARVRAYPISFAKRR